MNELNGKTFWDFLHANNLIKYSLLLAVIVLICSIVLFARNGYSITTSGIIAPKINSIQDSTKGIVQTDSTTSLYVLKDDQSDFSNKSTMAWILFSLIIFIIILQIIIIILQTFKSFNSNQVNSIKIKELKRIEIIEYIYDQLNDCSLNDRTQMDELLVKIQNLIKYIRKNGLYISKTYSKVFNEAADYYKNVIVDYTKKDYQKENEFHERIKELFNK